MKSKNIFCLTIILLIFICTHVSSGKSRSLTRTEEWVYKQIRDNGIADLNDSINDKNKRVLGGEFISALLTKKVYTTFMSKISDQDAIIIMNAVIKGEVVLNNQIIEMPLTFINCNFKSPFYAIATTFKNAVTFKNCTFNESYFTNSTFYNNFVAIDTVFEGQTDFSFTKFIANAKSLLVGVKKGYGIRTYRIGDWTYERREVWKEYLNACKKRSLSPTICLFFNQATRANIQTAFRIPSVKAIYIISDGKRKVGNVDRTFFEAWDGLFFSYLRRNWAGDPEDYISLGSYESGYSVTDSINYFNAKSHLHVFHDCCKNGPVCMLDSFYTGTMLVPPPQDNNWDESDYTRTIDMAKAYGITSSSTNRSYMSWRGFAFGDILHYTPFLKALWTELGNEDTYKVAFGEAALYDWGCYIPAQNFSHVGDLSDKFVP